MPCLTENYDVAVVGAGHAGCEAALASARLGLETIVFTVSVDSIALMPCNPNVGGSSKGHLVRELDALGGEMGKNIDKTFIQSKMLNQSKGPAVHSLRAQADKQEYTRQMRRTMENTDHLTIRQGEVAELIVEEGQIKGLKTYSGATYYCKAVVLATGTYLKARCIYGDVSNPTGPNGLQAANHLTDSLKKLGIEMERVILLKVVDAKWMAHIDDMDQLREGIGLQAYGQRDPLVEYKMSGYEMFDSMTAAIREDTVRILFHIRAEQKVEREPAAKVTGTNRDDSTVQAPKKREASFKRLHEGDIVTGTVVAVTDDQVLVDLKYFAQGVIDRENLSNDPDFNMKEEIQPGDLLTATVIQTDDGEGNVVLSRKEANDRMTWEHFRQLLDERTPLEVTISEVVNGGAVAMVEGVRGFIPASRLDAAYVEDLDSWNGKKISVLVIEADEEKKRLVLSGRELAREKQDAEKKSQIARCETGAIMEGTVETIKPYGAFVLLENGLSGLVHVSQMSKKRVENPGAVVKVGQKVTVKILSTANGKLSLSMKEVEPDEAPEEEVFNYHESGEATTGFAELLKGFKFD